MFVAASCTVSEATGVPPDAAHLGEGRLAVSGGGDKGRDLSPARRVQALGQRAALATMPSRVGAVRAAARGSGAAGIQADGSISPRPAARTTASLRLVTLRACETPRSLGVLTCAAEVASRALISRKDRCVPRSGRRRSSAPVNRAVWPSPATGIDLISRASRSRCAWRRPRAGRVAQRSSTSESRARAESGRSRGASRGLARARAGPGWQARGGSGCGGHQCLRLREGCARVAPLTVSESARPRCTIASATVP